MGMYFIRCGTSETPPYECEGDLDSAFLEVVKLWAAGEEVVYIDSPVVTLMCDRRETGTKAISGLFK